MYEREDILQASGLLKLRREGMVVGGVHPCKIGVLQDVLWKVYDRLIV